jgi:F-type H+-transporting ATPase subunit delta
MTKTAQGAARRYARALLDVLITTKGDGDAVQKDLEAAAQASAVPAERRRKVAEAVFKGGSLLSTRLLAMLIERDRVAALPEIARIFTSLWNEHKGVLPAEAVTAVPLDTAQREALGQALANASGKQVALTTRVDPAVLGGVVVHMGGRTFDGSVRARLTALRDRLVGHGTRA